MIPDFAKLDETKRDEFLTTPRDLDADDMTPDGFIDPDDLKMLVNEMANAGYLVPALDVEGVDSIAVDFEQDAEDDWAYLTVSFGPYSWPSLTPPGQKLRHWAGPDRSSWVAIADHLADEVVRHVNHAYAGAVEMARVLAAKHPA